MAKYTIEQKFAKQQTQLEELEDLKVLEKKLDMLLLLFNKVLNQVFKIDENSVKDFEKDPRQILHRSDRKDKKSCCILDLSNMKDSGFSRG